MPDKTTRTVLNISVLTFLLVVTPSLCFAMMSIGSERVKNYGHGESNE